MHVKYRALLASLALHGAILAALLFAVRLPSPPESEAPIQARLVNPNALAQAGRPAPAVRAPAPAPEPAPKPNPQPLPEPKPVETPPPPVTHEAAPKPSARQQAQEKALALQQERARQAELRQAQEAAARKAAAQAKQAAAQKALAAKAQAAAEKARRLQALKERIAAEAQAEAQRAQANAVRQKALQRLQEQVAAASARDLAAKEAARRTEAQNLFGQYLQRIKAKVSRNWNSGDIKPGLSTRVKVRLDTAGNVLTVRTIKSSGSAAFDRAVEAAVMRSSPLPIPNRPDLYSEFREIDFNFSAKDVQNG